jgi:hypothetical protein
VSPAPYLVLSALAALVLVGPGTAAEGPSPQTLPEEGHREEQGDPPAVVKERAAFAPASTVVRGGHVSVQVNTAGAGLNIVGDAANEPSLAVDPTNPLNLVIGWRQFNSVASNFRQAGYAYSHDGGATWTFPGVLQPGQFRSDPVLAGSSDGKFYYYSLSTTTSAEMFISSDKGHSWVGPHAGFGGDKQWMTVDVSGGAGSGLIHALWNSQFTCCAAGTDYTRSIDGGFLYQGPYAMPTKVKWGTPDVGPDGTLWVAGASLSQNTHYVLRATNAFNAALTPVFDRTVAVNLGGVTVSGGAPNPGGLLGQVWVAVDRSDTGLRGRVYVLASVDPPVADPLDVMLISSSDRGVTWSAPTRVNDEPAGASVYQWFGAISLAPTGRIDVTWYDTRIAAGGTMSEVYYAYSLDGGVTFSRGLPVSPAFNSVVGWPNQNKIGDYTQMVSDARGAALAYAATFNGEQDVWFVRVGDCNGNGLHDSEDLGAGTSMDCNGSGHPDECEALTEVCTTSGDEDCDGLADCADPDCDGAPGCDCDFDGVCAAPENCQSCPADCPSVAPYCGDGVCHTNDGENCVSCPGDCNGLQSGPSSGQFCCGSAGGGVNPVSCLDARCTAGSFECRKDVAPACCGDLSCDSRETPCACGIDCGTPTAQEGACGDGIDNDCDTAIDCADPNCAVLAAPPAGAPRLAAERSALGVRLSFGVPAGSLAFDLVHGDLDALIVTGNLGQSVLGCLANDLAQSAIDVQAGSGNRWFLVRPVGCSGPGSYDTGAAGQIASRDAAINGAGGCP